MGNMCEIFSFNKEYNKECNKECTMDQKNNKKNVPFLDISNINYDEHAEPPSYSQLRNIKNNQFNEYIQE